MIAVRLADGGRIAAEVHGRGRPLLLLRPLGGSVVSWGRFAEVLAERVRVVTFDPRGAGCSTAAPLGTTTRTMAADARAVLDAVGVERAAVYGLSLGGMVACRLALDVPSRVERLVLASTATRGVDAGAGSLARALSLAGCLARTPRAAEGCLAVRILSSRFRAAHPDAVGRIRAAAAARPGSHRGLLVLLAASARHDVRDRLGRIAAPTLVVAGADDEILPAARQRELAERLPHARFVVVPEVGHDVSAEAPDATAHLVLEHLGMR